jgi:hypothetical protein
MEENYRLINIEFNKIYRDIEIIYNKKKFDMMLDNDDVLYFKSNKKYHLKILKNYINKITNYVDN